MFLDKFRSRKEIKMTIDIPEYNIALATNNILIYEKCLSILYQKEIDIIINVLFQDSVTQKNTDFLEFLINDNRFDITKTNKLFLFCSQYGDLVALKRLYQYSELVNKKNIKESLYTITFFKYHDSLKYVIDESKLDTVDYLIGLVKTLDIKYDFNDLFLRLYGCYVLNLKIYKFSPYYKKYVVNLYINYVTKLNEIQESLIFNEHSICFCKEMTTILKGAKIINEF
jgi:hypothetical protein